MRRPPRFHGRQHNARSLALQVLLDCRRHDAFVQEILDQRLGESPLLPADRRLATQLAYGVLRRRGTLHALLRPFIRRQPNHVEPWLWDALGLGAYQLALLTHVPPHAALNETVELANLFGRPGAKGFLNGVLRKVASLVTDERTEAPAADALPLEQGQYRRLARPVLPDPATHALEYLSAAFALPGWLAQRWHERYGAGEGRRLGFWLAGPAPLTLRCNPLRCSRDELLRKLAEAQVAAEPGTHPQSALLLLGPCPCSAPPPAHPSPSAPSPKAAGGGSGGAGNLGNEIGAGGLAAARSVLKAEAAESPIQTPQRAQGTKVRTDTTTRCPSQDRKPRPLFLAADVTRRGITDSKRGPPASTLPGHFIRTPSTGS